MIWLLIGYMWLFIHRPFEVWPVFGAMRLERLYMFALVGCWLLSGRLTLIANRLNWYFLGFVLVVLLSWSVSPYQAAGDLIVANYLKYALFYVILISSVRTSTDLKMVLAGHMVCLTILMAHTVREYLLGNVYLKQGILRMDAVGVTFKNANDFAGLIVCSLPFSWVLWRESHQRWHKGVLLGHFGLAAYCIMQTGSRMGFIGLVLGSLLACLTSPHRWRWLVLYPVAAIAIWCVIPQDRKDRYLTLLDSTSGPTSAAESAGNLRFDGFEKALPLFEQRPLLGFGPESFGQATGRKLQAHNLYGQLLAELGLAGTIAFGLIFLGVGQNTLEAYRLLNFGSDGDELAWRTVLAASASFLLLAIMSWGFNFLFWHVWLWFGAFQVVAVHCLKNRLFYGELPTADGSFESELPELAAT